MNTKSLAQLAYEADVGARPLHEDGTPRPPWAALSDIARWSWARDPSPRDWSNFPLYRYMLDGQEAARLGYGEDANPYMTPEPRPLGFDTKGVAWAAGWAFASLTRQAA